MSYVLEVIMATTFRPLLAATIDGAADLERLRGPMIASPKVDGIRTFCHPTFGAVSRSLKPVPNRYIRGLLASAELSGLDGEITVGPPNAPDCFARTVSAVMSHAGEPDFTYHVFDHTVGVDVRDMTPYHERLKWTAQAALMCQAVGLPVIPLLSWEIESQDVTAINAREQWCVENGYEGLMLRHRESPYKFGRSTFREQILLKLKRWEDAEAEITGFQELERNQNAAEVNALGLTERSDHKAGFAAAGTLGAFVVRHPSYGEFTVGSGLDDSLRDQIWQNRDSYQGRQITFKFQKVGVVDKPRFPIFKGFRPEE